MPLQGAGNLLDFKDLDQVSHFYIGVVLHADTTLHAVANVAGVVLEATQRLQLALVDHHVVTQHANGLGAIDSALVTIQPAIWPNFGERNTSRTSAMPTISSRNSGASIPVRLLHIVNQIVDDVVITQIYGLALHQRASGVVGTHIESQTSPHWTSPQE